MAMAAGGVVVPVPSSRQPQVTNIRTAQAPGIWVGRCGLGDHSSHTARQRSSGVLKRRGT